MNKTNKVKIISILIFVVLLTIIVLQNTDPVKLNFLWISVEAPVIILTIGSAIIGFILGLLTDLLIKK